MVKINIEINPINIYLEEKISNAVVIKGNYKKLNNQVINILKEFAKNNNNITLEDILSIRSAYMNIKIMKRHTKLLKNINKFYKLYKKRINISEMSKKYDLSPIQLLKHIFLKMNFSKHEIKEFFYLKNLSKLNSFDINQIKFALKNDIFNKVDQSEQLKNSGNFEKEIEIFLVQNKIKFKTQEQLAKIQIQKYGKPINTPDFLILSDFFINNQKINWIDAKNFYGANTFLINKKIKKQVDKYINKFGFGCIMFSLNFSEKLSFDNVLFVNFYNRV
tara:strand:+ start:130 stop:957 length:828 start_codon:yes stop_codon:yes gene_type:complete